MIGRLLSRATPWLLAGGLAAAVGLYVYVNALHGQLEHVRQESAKTQAALDVTTATLAVQVERNRRMTEALDERDNQLTDGAQRIQTLRARASALGADDADNDSRKWLDQRVPGGVSRWVRDLASPDTGADGSAAAELPD